MNLNAALSKSAEGEKEIISLKYGNLYDLNALPNSMRKNIGLTQNGYALSGTYEEKEEVLQYIYDRIEDIHGWGKNAEADEVLRQLNDQISELHRAAQYKEELNKQLDILSEGGTIGGSDDDNINKTADGLKGISNEAEDAQKNTEELSTTIDNLKKSSSDLVTEYDKIYDSLDKLKNGEALTYEQIQELLSIYPDLAEYIHVTADGYSVEVEALEGLNKAVKNSASKRISEEKRVTNAVIAEQIKQMEAYARNGEFTKAQETKDKIAILNSLLVADDTIADYLSSPRKTKATSTSSTKTTEKQYTLKDADSNMKTLSDAIAEQNASGGLSAKTVEKLSETKYKNAFEITAEGKVRLTPEVVDSDLRSEIEKAIKDLNAQIAATDDPAEIKAINAKITAYDQLRAAIDDVTSGLYGVKTAEQAIVDDSAFKEAEKLANKRLDAINAELKAKQELRDATLKAIDDEVQARKRLTEDNDIQHQIDQVTAQLKYSQLDDFSRRQLERRLQQLKNDQADLAWERSIEDRRTAAKEDYDTSAEQLEAERETIENSLSVLKDLNKTTADGFTNLIDVIKEAFRKTAAGRAVNVTFNNADKLSTAQIVNEVFRMLGADNVM